MSGDQDSGNQHTNKFNRNENTNTNKIHTNTNNTKIQIQTKMRSKVPLKKLLDRLVK